MTINDTNLDKIYKETASVIMDLSYKKQINEVEMYFLLNLLDMIWVENKGDNLIETLKMWQNQDNPTEIDEIIKQTLLTLDFTSDDSLEEMAKFIKELLFNQS